MQSAEWEQAKNSLLGALQRALAAEVPAEVATLPRVTNLQIERQWQDPDTGFLMASGVAEFANGTTVTGDLGRLIPVVKDDVVVGYRLATVPGQETPGETGDCDHGR